ncbi:MAG: adenylosuccinate lyase [Sphaerochaetaceae bacterium]|nr:adenylosuccinate lyase [Sphaerochaetaceae bacterium]
MEYGFDTFISPLTWRYGSQAMKGVWSEKNKRLILRQVWIALATAQNKAGIVTDEQLVDLKAHANDIDIERALEIESSIHHDLMAEIKTYAEQCPIGGGVIHMGATSMDVLDNADAIRLAQAVEIILEKTKELRASFADKATTYAKVPCMAFTHIQSAEVTTVGYRLALVIQDLDSCISELEGLVIKGKGMKGAVGTRASYKCLLEGTSMGSKELDDAVMQALGIVAFDGATQVYPRTQDLKVMHVLDDLSCAIAKFALDFRMMQSTGIGEWSEPFGKNQVGSSAMPFKRNPINCEKVDSLCRYVHSLVPNAWDNASLSILERTLDDSANRRLFLPQAFLAMDEVLVTANKVVKGMNIHEATIGRNLSSYGVFAATERLLMNLGKRGADRQMMHEVIRQESLKSWACVQEGKENPLVGLLSSNEEILKYMTCDEVVGCLDASDYYGDAADITMEIVEKN